MTRMLPCRSHSPFVNCPTPTTGLHPSGRMRRERTVFFAATYYYRAGRVFTKAGTRWRLPHFLGFAANPTSTDEVEAALNQIPAVEATWSELLPAKGL